MSKFNLKSLGINYTVLDQDTQETETICVINCDELQSVMGEYIGADYQNLDLHTKDILNGFKGFARSPYHITWYSVVEGEFDLSKAIMAARRENNTIVVAEILPAKELDTGLKIS